MGDLKKETLLSLGLRVDGMICIISESLLGIQSAHICLFRTKEKHENKYIKVSKEDYEKVIEILKKEGIEIN